MPSVFYDMEFTDFMLLREGWVTKMRIDEAIARKQTFIVSMSMGAKLAELEKNWPDPFKQTTGKKMVVYKGQTMTEHQMKTLVRLKEESNKRKQEKRK